MRDRGILERSRPREHGAERRGTIARRTAMLWTQAPGTGVREAGRPTVAGCAVSHRYPPLSRYRWL